MNNIQKAFKTKSKLRGMADGGAMHKEIDPDVLGTGGAARAGHQIRNHNRRTAAEIDSLFAPTASPTPQSAPAKKPEEKSALRSFFGLADGGSPADVDRIMNSRDMSIFTPQEMKTFNAMGQAAMADAAQMQDVGVQAGQAALAAARPAELPAVGTNDMAPPEIELADGGKVKGKGGPTDDKVGPVALSDGEYVLPADTVDIVGRDKLDALRLATHDFVDEDNKPKVSGLRKMVNGGPVTSGISVEELNDPASRRAFQQARVATSMGNHFGAQTILNDAIPRHQFAPEPPPAASPKPSTEVPRPQAGGSSNLGGVSRAAGALRGLGLVGNAVAAIPAMDASVGEWARGIPGVLRREPAPQPNTKVRFLDGQPAAELRTPEPVFNPTPAELDRRGALRPVSVDDAMGNLRSGDAPGGGFQQVPGTDVYRRNNPNAGNPGESARQYIGVGTPAPQEDPIMGEIRSALRGLTDGAGNRGGGASISSNAREINARYDALAKQLSGMYGREGQGNLARRLLELEQSRSGALDADQRNRSALRGQDMQASTAANNADMQARMQALQTLGTMANQRSTQSAQAQAAQLKALTDAQRSARQGEEKGFERYTSAIGSMFVGPDGKPDAAEQERFTSFLQASDPQAQQKFAAMSPQDQTVLLQNFKTLYDMQKARNATAESGGGAITNRADMPVDVREATWNDYWNNNLPLGDYVWSNVPFTNPNVVVTESGQPTLMSDYATTDGNWDADKLEMIRQRTGKDREGRSALRGN